MVGRVPWGFPEGVPGVEGHSNIGDSGNSSRNAFLLPCMVPLITSILVAVCHTLFACRRQLLSLRLTRYVPDCLSSFWCVVSLFPRCSSDTCGGNVTLDFFPPSCSFLRPCQQSSSTTTDQPLQHMRKSGCVPQVAHLCCGSLQSQKSGNPVIADSSGRHHLCGILIHASWLFIHWTPLLRITISENRSSTASSSQVL